MSYFHEVTFVKGAVSRGSIYVFNVKGIIIGPVHVGGVKFFWLVS
jgi:hypothetical protein